MNSSKYFEILSHPIRYSILRYLNINICSFSDIQVGLNSDHELISSTAQLSFHLRKMQDEKIIIKNDNYYSASELGVKLLNLIDQIEDEDKQNNQESKKNKKMKVQLFKNLETDKNNLPIIKRPENLNHLASILEYFEGKNYAYMEEKFFLSLPECITPEVNPKEWIAKFSRQILSLRKDHRSKEWLIDRYLKLGYGTRGLQDYGLMDASLTVPPLKSFFKIIIDLLLTRGKAGLYGETGMGKSRLSLYVASYWNRTFKTPVISIQNPHLMQYTEYQNLQDVLDLNTANDRNAPKWLVIIEDAHLVDEEHMLFLKKLISGASNKSYSIFISFTKIESLKTVDKYENLRVHQIEQLYRELIPQEIESILNLQAQWTTLKPYFYEWLRWVAVDILFDYIPNPEKISSDKSIHNSPWSFVVSLGFLKNSLNLLTDTSIIDKFSLILYYFLAQLYIMRNGKGISLKCLQNMLKNFFYTDLSEIYGEKIDENIISLLNMLSSPEKRLLPPFQHPKKNDSITNDVIISFYHIQWAQEVCNFLDLTENISLYNKIFTKVFPVPYEMWTYLRAKEPEEYFLFSKWIRENVKFQIHDQKTIIVTSLSLESKEKKLLKEFKLSEKLLKSLDQTNLINWLFIKSIFND